MTDGIIQKVFNKWIEWEGLHNNADLLDVEQELIEEINKESEKWRLSTSRVEIRHGITLLKEKLIGDNEK